MTGRNSKDKATWITELIRDWVNTSPENTLQNKANDKAWDDPLVGFSRGDDPYWESFKEHVGPFHWTPAEAFMMAFPNGNISPERLTVVSWVLPQMKQTKMDTRKEKMYPPESWARGRFYGEVVNEKLRKLVVGEFEGRDPGRGPYAPSQVVPDGFGQVRLCLKVVRAPRRLRLGSGDLRALRRPHHTPGEGHARRVGYR